MTRPAMDPAAKSSAANTSKKKKCVFMLCFLSVFSPLCFLLSVFFFVLSVFSVCVIRLCFLLVFLIRLRLSKDKL